MRNWQYFVQDVSNTSNVVDAVSGTRSPYSPGSLQPILTLNSKLTQLTISISRLSPSRFLLFIHFFAVAFYSIWVMFTHPRIVRPDLDSFLAEDGEKPRFKFERPSVIEYPSLMAKSVRVVRITSLFVLSTQISFTCAL